MQKTSGKMIRGTLIVGNGKVGPKLAPNQELGKSCHKINDLLQPGIAINRQKWEDTPHDPDDLEFDRRQVQH